MNGRRRVGFAGPLDPATSLHSLWIGRAVEVARCRLRAVYGDQVELVAENDQASRGGGEESAHRLLAAGVHAGAGYFSSAAAAAAIPHFSGAQVPLVLAGATVEELTDAPQVYRVCDSESTYADWIARVVRDRGMNRLRIAHQHSAFGGRMARALRSRLVEDRDAARHLLCLGQAEFAHGLFRRRRLTVPELGAILLTDDCQHPRRVAAIAEATGRDTEILIAGYGLATAAGDWAVRASRRRWSEPPGAFYFETVAAIEVATRLAVFGTLAAPFRTAIGILRFDERGEARPNRFCLYRFQHGLLCPV